MKEKEDASLDSGKEKIVQKGKEGKLKKHFHVVKENGKEVSRKLVKEETSEKAKIRSLRSAQSGTVPRLSSSVHL